MKYKLNKPPLLSVGLALEVVSNWKHVLVCPNSQIDRREGSSSSHHTLCTLCLTFHRPKEKIECDPLPNLLPRVVVRPVSCLFKAGLPRSQVHDRAYSQLSMATLQPEKSPTVQWGLIFGVSEPFKEFEGFPPTILSRLSWEFVLWDPFGLALNISGIVEF